MVAAGNRQRIGGGRMSEQSRRRAGAIGLVLGLVTLMLILWLCPDVIFKKFFAARSIDYTFQFAHKAVLLMMVFAEAVCLFLANRFIKKDEALVRSADRLR